MVECVPHATLLQILNRSERKRHQVMTGRYSKLRSLVRDPFVMNGDALFEGRHSPGFAGIHWGIQV